MNVRVAQMALRVVEVPSYERNRVNGTSNLHAVRDGLRVLRTIAAERRHSHSHSHSHGTGKGSGDLGERAVGAADGAVQPVDAADRSEEHERAGAGDDAHPVLLA